MQPFEIKIHDRAIQDIWEGFNYYEEKQTGLGIRFNRSVFIAFESLKLNPFYQVRYSTFRCLPLKRFPYMIHFEIDEQLKRVNVYAVVNAYLDPKDSWLQ